MFCELVKNCYAHLMLFFCIITHHIFSCIADLRRTHGYIGSDVMMSQYHLPNLMVVIRKMIEGYPLSHKLQLLGLKNFVYVVLTNYFLTKA